jgi:hypothetical protein
MLAAGGSTSLVEEEARLLREVIVEPFWSLAWLIKPKLLCVPAARSREISRRENRIKSAAL